MCFVMRTRGISNGRGKRDLCIGLVRGDEEVDDRIWVVDMRERIRLYGEEAEGD